MVETSSPGRWGGCRSSGRRRSEAGARMPRVEGRCRNVARAITTHRFGLWAVLEAVGNGLRRIRNVWSTAPSPAKSERDRQLGRDNCYVIVNAKKNMATELRTISGNSA